MNQEQIRAAVTQLKETLAGNEAAARDAFAVGQLAYRLGFSRVSPYYNDQIREEAWILGYDAQAIKTYN